MGIEGRLTIDLASAPDRTGRVIHTERAGLTLPVELRPGDAALFEIFSREQ